MTKNRAEHRAILIIAGSDSGGGAGIQADIKTATAHKTFATTAITCITAQNTVGVKAVLPLGLDIIKKQIEAVLDDFPIKVIKTGMLFSAEIIDLVIAILQERDFCNIRQEKILLLVDPVMVATSGDLLIDNNALKSLHKLISLADVVTPNIDEARIIANCQIDNLEDMQESAKIIAKIGAKNILIKGGHLAFYKTNGKDSGKITNLLLQNDGRFFNIVNKRLNLKAEATKIQSQFHGTGCSLATAIACNLANGYNLEDAVVRANNYIAKAVANYLNLGNGSKLLNHFLAKI